MPAPVTGYHRLVVWQKADALVREVYQATQSFPHEEQFGLTAQLRRAALSVPLNIVEGYARQSGRSFANFLAIAYGSLMEVKYLIELSVSLGYRPVVEADPLMGLIHETARLLWQFRRRLRV